MMFAHNYVVITYQGYNGGHTQADAGHWTGHATAQDARAVALRVKGKAYAVRHLLQDSYTLDELED